MHLTSLNIGPSEIAAEVIADIREIAESGLLTESHRGAVVQETVKEAMRALRQAMAIPPDHVVVVQPSATACMDLILRNTVAAQSFHFVQGAFAGRFATTAEQIGLAVGRDDRPWDGPAAPSAVDIPQEAELITVTHNETSTGRMWPWQEVRDLRARHPAALLAVDVTSSFGAMAMDWSLGDLWFCSIQKCLGLPAGLGLLIAGPRAVARAVELGARRRVAAWQDLPALAEQMALGQTPETPNVFALALLGRQMRRWDLTRIETETRAKVALVAELLGDAAFFVREPAWRSLTTHCIRADDPAAWKARAQAAGFSLGSGYGPLKAHCIRLATFPAVPITALRTALTALAP